MEEPDGLLSIGSHSRTWLRRLSMHARIGEGNGNPLQCSCLENPRDGGAWRAAVYGVTQSQTRLKQLSSMWISIFLICSADKWIVSTFQPVWTMPFVYRFSFLLGLYLGMKLFDPIVILDGFELLCWRRRLRVPWTARRSNQSILKAISPEYSLEGLMLKMNLQ